MKKRNYFVGIWVSEMIMLKVVWNQMAQNRDQALAFEAMAIDPLVL